ncbi:MAG: hypothetical protein IT538_09675 [Variibacter sp.]|nr:hypothetical protein [Variibacter sp.]
MQRPPFFPLSPHAPQAALDYEIAQEKASTLGRMGRRLEERLAALTAFDADRHAVAPHSPQDAEARRQLVAEAGQALWHFVIQREALGLRDSARVLRDYNVPDEVRNRMGMAIPIEPGRRRPRVK